MKKIFVGFLIGALSLSLVGCGGSVSYSNGGGSYSKAYTTDAAAGFATNSFTESVYDSYSDDYYFDNTYISGELTDYEYTFNAEGATTKAKEELLSYYESLQELVIDNGGYIDNVNNNYNYYMIDSDSYWMSSSEKANKSSGQLRFTVEVPNESADLVLADLENFCKDNKFTVTTYNQHIVNYVGYDVVDNYDDLDYWERHDKITQHDLDKRIKYAEIYVNIWYYTPRPFISRLWLEVRNLWIEFWDALGEAIMVFLIIGLGILFIAIESIILYKLFRKRIYKHRMKNPEYYEPKQIVIVDKIKERSEQ